MDRMKTFFKYLLIFVAFLIISNIIINAYITTSYYKITNYDIDVKEATVTIMTAKASKDDGYIEGKIYNNTKEEIKNKYMRIELFSGNNVSLGTKFVKIESMYPEEIKDFKIRFTYDNVKSFTIKMYSEEQKNEEEKPAENILPSGVFQTNSEVKKITDNLKP